MNDNSAYTKDIYAELIEFLRTDFLEDSIYRIRNNEIHFARIKKDVESAFDIVTTKNQFNKAVWIKRYTITEKNGNKRWDVAVTTADVLYVNHMRKYREQLLVDNTIQGIFTLKNSFYEYVSFPSAVIVFETELSDKIWLTSVTSIQDVIELFTDIKGYNRNVYYTERLDTKSFMPEYYNGDKQRIDESLEKYETKPLKDIADIILGKSGSRDDFGEEGIPYLRVRNIKQGVICEPDSYIVETAGKKYAKQLVQEGDILLSKNFGQHKVAKVTIDNVPAIVSNGLFIIRSFGVPEDYLFQYFTSETGKAILDKQLTSIEHGVTVASINKADLEELKVPIFDKSTMIELSHPDELKLNELVYNSSFKSRMMKYAEAIQSMTTESTLESQIYSDLHQAGWKENEVQLNNKKLSLPLKNSLCFPDILLFDGDALLGVVEIKTDFGRISSDWLLQISEVIKEAKVPCLILSTGFYYELHFTRKSIVKKMKEAPSKDYLLSVINGKEGD